MRLDRHPRSLLLAGLLASAGFSAFAQAPAAPVAEQAPPAASVRKAGPAGDIRHDPAARQQRIDQRFAQLKQKLHITPQQEGAWSAFVAGARPSGPGANGKPRFDREEFAKLTTPQRIDRMREMRARHAAEADRRGEAVKTFYAALTPAQQQTFDQQPMHRGFGPGGPGGHRHHGGGMPPPPPAAPAAR
ncbi:Spy/CpxP family protein refolding chaperone [uncultured Xylophilus sp.]|uniref:Spy/CpxP family protein refolding chaperone n=1 Tax=uncultured Xylophilus sp. TaxID=296832 RepID=UPI0025FD073D|nr:Spy/CpxP family protein refolding chaperone [uncultured Xylophilus sp.]